MNIKHTLESLSIETSDDRLFSELSSLISKNFKKTITNKGKILSFYEENELPQRKYFLKFIKKLYDKKNTNELDVRFAEYKTIKLNYIQENTLAKLLFVKICFTKDEVVFRLKNSEKKFFSYILTIFKENKFKINETETRLNLKINSNNDIKALKNLFSQKNHIKYVVNFSIQNEEFKKFQNSFNLKNSPEFINRFSALANLLEDNFKTLNCSKNSNYDQIRESYLNLVKAYHPDRHTNKSDNIKSVYRDKFEQIQQAYEGLKPYFKSQQNFISA